jgi:hypothetical protein
LGCVVLAGFEFRRYLVLGAEVRGQVVSPMRGSGAFVFRSSDQFTVMYAGGRGHQKRGTAAYEHFRVGANVRVRRYEKLK